MTDIIADTSGQNLADTKGVVNILKLVWEQTWPVFAPPHVGKTLKMSFLIFILFSIGHGTFMWFASFFTEMQKYTDVEITLCDVLSRSNIVAARNATNTTELLSHCTASSSDLLSFKIIFLIGVVFTLFSFIIGMYINYIGQNLYVSKCAFTNCD